MNEDNNFALGECVVATTARWVPDKERNQCVCCLEKFSVLRRKHHCRLCGEVCCMSCLDKFAVDGFEKPQNVCVACREAGGSTPSRTVSRNFSRGLDAAAAAAAAAVAAAAAAAAAAAGGSSSSSSVAAATQHAAQVLMCSYVMKQAKPGSNTWNRFFLAVQDLPQQEGSMAGHTLCLFESEKSVEMGDKPLAATQLMGAEARKYEPNVFARVKKAWHFGVKSSDGVSQEQVYEAETQAEQQAWVSCLRTCGAYVHATVPFRHALDVSVKEGYLEKIGKKETTKGLFGGWKTRYCILLFNPHRIEYFATAADAKQKKILGKICLDSDTAVSSFKGTYKVMEDAFSVTPKGGRRYVFAASDAAEVADWISLIDEVKISHETYGIRRATRRMTVAPQTLAEEDSDNEDIPELSPQQKRDVAEKEKEIQAEAAERIPFLQEAQAYLGEEQSKMENQRKQVLAEAKRLNCLLRVARKGAAQVSELEREVHALMAKVDQTKVSTKQMVLRIEDDKLSNINRKQDIAEREDALVDWEQQIAAREKERDRRDKLLVEFSYVVNKM